MKKVDCPLMDECVDDAICFDIHMVVEGCAPLNSHAEKSSSDTGF
mgnify:CR=1 FL=1